MHVLPRTVRWPTKSTQTQLTLCPGPSETCTTFRSRGFSWGVDRRESIDRLIRACGTNTEPLQRSIQPVQTSMPGGGWESCHLVVACSIMMNVSQNDMGGCLPIDFLFHTAYGAMSTFSLIPRQAHILFCLERTSSELMHSGSI